MSNENLKNELRSQSDEPISPRRSRSAWWHGRSSIRRSRRLPENEYAEVGMSRSLHDELIIKQIGECWADNRNFDVIVWQIPAVIAAIAGLMLNALVRQDASINAWVKPLIPAGAALVTFPLVLALLKNRIFQIERNNWRIALYNNLTKRVPISEALGGIRPEPPRNDNLVRFSSPQITSKFKGPWYWRFWANRLKGVRAYNALFFVSVVVLLSEVALAIWLTVVAFLDAR